MRKHRLLHLGVAPQLMTATGICSRRVLLSLWFGIACADSKALLKVSSVTISTLHGIVLRCIASLLPNHAVPICCCWDVIIKTSDTQLYYTHEPIHVHRAHSRV